jgi:c-di-GMP-binding flagellar brake protein YcgR
MDTTPFPEPESPELERFWIYSPVEILALASRLRSEQVEMTLFWGRDGECAVTSILEVDAVHGQVKLDLPGVDSMREAVLAAGSLTCVAFIDNVKIQFSLRAPRMAAADGGLALQCAVPERMLRLQRREYFRVRTPHSLSASCLVPDPADGVRYESLRVLDLSVGGLAMMAYPLHLELAASTTIDRCFLDLPGVGTINVRMRIAHVEPPGKDGSRRCGCEFVDLSPHSRMLLQRYVQRIDVEQAHRTGPRRAA